MTDQEVLRLCAAFAQKNKIVIPLKEEYAFQIYDGVPRNFHTIALALAQEDHLPFPGHLPAALGMEWCNAFEEEYPDSNCIIWRLKPVIEYYKDYGKDWNVVKIRARVACW